MNASQKRVVICYGAGGRGSYALQILKKKGIFPVAFCDADPLKTGSFYEGYPVLNKRQVTEKYGDSFDIWITPEYPLKAQIQTELIESGFITENRVLNGVGADQYVSCPDLRKTMIVVEHGLYHCCCIGGTNGNDLSNTSPYESLSEEAEDIETCILNFMERRKSLLEDLRRGRENVCTGCPQLKKQYWEEDSGKINVLALSPNYPCQLSCTYCSVVSNARNISQYKDIVERAKKVDLVRILQVLEDKNLLDLMEPIQLSAGEITIHPQKREILSCLSKYPLMIFSNCVLYDEQISRLIARNGSLLNVSIDAGTPETYKKVKGMDAFDKVLENLERYRAEGGNIEAKYILVPENCDKKDLDGFLQFCNKSKVNTIAISCDTYADHKNMDDRIIDAAIYMAKRSKAFQLPYSVLPYFGEKNMRRIAEALEE